MHSLSPQPQRPAQLFVGGYFRGLDYARTNNRPRMNEEQARYEALYRATLYRARAGGLTFDLRIDVVSHQLGVLLRQHGVATAAYLTAHNPRSVRLSEAENRAANEQLRAALLSADAFIYEGEAIDPRNVWPPEPSFLALGLAFATARELGVRFRQNAILFADDDGVPRLVWVP
jgi:hypothetical protein